MNIVFINDEHVPASEYEAIIQLLDDNDVDYVERPRLIGSLIRFGANGAGTNLVVETEAQYRKARALIDEYQKELVDGSRVQYEARKPNHRQREIFGWMLAIVVIVSVLALSLSIGF